MHNTTNNHFMTTFWDQLSQPVMLSSLEVNVWRLLESLPDALSDQQCQSMEGKNV